MNVLIVGDLFGFPNFTGSGATTRVNAYARGIHANGARVKVLCVEPTERGEAKVNTQVKGVVDGVEFEYTYGLTARPAPGLRRRVMKITKWWRFFHEVRTWAPESGGVDAMIVYSRKTGWIAAARLACWLSGAVLIHEDVERPFVWHAVSARVRARRWTYEHVTFKSFDGCLAISNYLREYCAAHVRSGASVIVVPILVDVDEFADAGETDPAVDDRVVYCGSLSHPQSVSVIETFAAIAAEFPGLRLQLVGGSRRAAAEGELRALAQRLGVAERVEFAGKVPREELIRLLRTARVLVLPRSADAAAEAAAAAALPTKVGEYLAAGRPAVVSATGDIPAYLTDGVDAYLAPSTDIDAFTARLRYALSHPDEADMVGMRGRETARRCFDPVSHGARILEFAEQLRGAAADSPRRRRPATWRPGR